MSAKKSNEEIENIALLLSDDDEEEILNVADNTKKSKHIVEDSTKTKVNRVQSQIQDVIGSMKTNINKIIDRGETLDDLNDRSQDLSHSANLFQTRARSARKSMYFRTCRVRLRYNTKMMPDNLLDVS